MKPIIIKPCSGLKGIIRIPGDKSISHRAAILSALAKGKTEIKNFLFSDDCLVTLNTLKHLGVRVVTRPRLSEAVIISPGFLKKPSRFLNMGESGTSARMFLGLLAGQDFCSIIGGASSLLHRPMLRVLEPLRLMGACVRARKIKNDEFLPCEIFSNELHGFTWEQKVPSAQVKSAILLAGLFAKGVTSVVEPVRTRDHTERMLKLFGAQISIEHKTLRIRKSVLKSPGEIFVASDISSAAFFIVAALLIKNSKIILKNVSINPTRMGAIRVLKRMGAYIKVSLVKESFEPRADLEVCFSSLKGTIVKAREIPALIDELPILMVAASKAKGKTLFEGVGELRVKETDRIRSMEFNLLKLGVDIRVKSLKESENIEIQGADSFKGACLKSFADHRTAMSMIVAALSADTACSIDDVSCISKSFPQFLTLIKTSCCIS
jgi:3-phosphoshikimate 1-carboxyvinyltransferase